ncbi:MAG: hypothetical protein RL095_1692 [Verrucomicrobiota bacterium]|jgi:hypothetical protein
MTSRAHLASAFLCSAVLASCSSDSDKEAKITNDETARFLASQFKTRGKATAQVLGPGQSLEEQRGLDVEDSFRLKDGSMNEAEFKEALAKAKPGDREALRRRQAEILKHRAGVEALKADDMARNKHRSSVHAETATADLIATLERLRQPGVDPHAEEAVSIIFEALCDPRRKDGRAAVPVLAKYLDDGRPAYFEAIATQESEENHQRWFYEDANKFIPMTLGLYAALHMQILAETQPKNVDFKIHASGVYLAQSGPFAINSADLLKAWKEWWEKNQTDFLQGKK